MSELHVVQVPYLGVSIEEATVVAWLKQPGERVEAGETVCELASDKVDIEVPAPVGGVLGARRFEEGAVAPVGSALADIDPLGAPGGPVPRPAETPEASAPRDVEARPPIVAQPEVVVPSASVGERRLTSVRRFDHRQAADALERQRDEVARESDRAAESSRGSVSRGALVPQPVAVAVAEPITPSPAKPPAGFEDVDHVVVPHSRRRRLIAEHMVRSRRTSAHMTTTVEVEMTCVALARTQIEATAGEPRPTYLAFLAHATCSVLRRHPHLNATFTDEGLLCWRPVHLGIAVDTPDGLIVPVVRDADQFTVPALARRISMLAEAARENRLTPDDVRGGTITISNPGSAGATSAMAIINQPQVAILGMATIVRRVVALPSESGSDQIAVRPMMELALTYDHRAVDGAAATRCAVEIKDVLEHWPAPAGPHPL